MNKLRTDFDLPTNHLKGLKAYIPPKARSSTEIDRRHELPKGSLILEHQEAGAKVMRFLLTTAKEAEDVRYVTKIAATADANTASYAYGQTDEVMRRRLKLPLLAVTYNESPLTEQDLVQRSEDNLSEVIELARLLRIAHVTKDSTTRKNKLRKSVGQACGNAALSLNCVTLANELEGVSPFKAQDMARIACLSMLQEAKALSSELSYPPSLAQLPDPNSELSVHIRRTAPNNVYEAFDEAISRYEITR